jgi:hypothetical protein
VGEGNAEADELEEARALMAASTRAMSPCMDPPEKRVSAMLRTESGSLPERVSL